MQKSQIKHKPSTINFDKNTDYFHNIKLSLSAYKFYLMLAFTIKLHQTNVFFQTILKLPHHRGSLEIYNSEGEGEDNLKG